MEGALSVHEVLFLHVSPKSLTLILLIIIDTLSCTPELAKGAESASAWEELLFLQHIKKTTNSSVPF